MFSPFLGGFEPSPYDYNSIYQPVQRCPCGNPRCGGHSSPNKRMRLHNGHPVEYPQGNRSPQQQRRGVYDARQRWADQQRAKELKRREMIAAQEEQRRQALKERQRKEAEAKQMREEAFEAEMQRRREHAEKRRQMIALEKKRGAAARVIQKAWRDHREYDAALTITEFIRSSAAINRARRILSKLKTLKGLQDEIDAVEQELVSSGPTTQKQLLWIQDALEKICLRVDDVSTLNSRVVRAARKRTVGKAQAVLARSDAVYKGLTRAASTIQRCYRRHLDTKRRVEKDKAAAIVTRFIRSMPSRKKASADIGAMKRVVDAERAVEQLKTSFLGSLRQVLDTLPTTEQISDEKIIQERAAEAQRAIQALMEKMNQ